MDTIELNYQRSLNFFLFFGRSLAFFHQPNWDAEIKCLDTCKGDKVNYHPVRSGPYLMSKFKSTL